MSYIVTNQKFSRYENGVSKSILEISADTVADLPTTEQEPSMLMGSVAYVTANGGGVYRLDSAGVWQEQTNFYGDIAANFPVVTQSEYDAMSDRDAPFYMITEE